MFISSLENSLEQFRNQEIDNQSLIKNIETLISEYKAGSQSIGDSNRYIHHLCNSSPIYCVIVDTAGKIVKCTESASLFIAGTKKDISGQFFQTFIHKNSKEAFQKWFQQTVKKEKPEEPIEIEFAGRKQNSKYVHIKALTFTEKNKTNVHLSFIDVSEYRNTENELTQNRKQLLDVINRLDTGIALISLSGQFININDSFCDLIGYAREEILRMTFHEITYFEDVDIGTEFLKKFRNDEIDEINLQKRYVHKDGSLKWVDLNVTLHHDDDKNPDYLISFITDITKQKKTEQTLEKWNSVFKYAEWGIAVLDSKTYCLDMINPAFAKILERSEDYLKGKSLSEVFTISDNTFTECIKTAQRENKTGCETIHKNPEGEDLNILLNITVIKNKQEEIEYTIVHIHDITEHRQTENRLERAKEQVQKSEKLKTAFLTNISHEIRTPLNGILGFAQLLKNRQLNQKKHEQYVNFILDSGNQLLNIMNNILDISQIESGNVKINNVEYPLNLTMVELYTKYNENPKIREGIKLYLKRTLEDDYSKVITDHAKVKLVLDKLLNNAFKFTTEGFVEFGYSIDIVDAETCIHFFVSDTGIGIAEDKIESIFNKFIQADNELTRQYGGTGLGLTIAKAYIEMLGGKIWVKSVVGGGATFHFILPYEPARDEFSDAEMKTKKKLLEQFKWHDKTILIVEDDYVSYQYLEELLEITGAKIIGVDTGEEAVRICRDRPDIDIVLMDIQLPEMSGYIATEKIRRIRSDIPVIAQTAKVLPSEKEKCFKAGCDDYIAKPIESKLLFSTIQKYMDLYSQENMID